MALHLLNALPKKRSKRCGQSAAGRNSKSNNNMQQQENAVPTQGAE